MAHGAINPQSGDAASMTDSTPNGLTARAEEAMTPGLIAEAREALLPCPFCGYADVKIQGHFNSVSILCPSCNASSGVALFAVEAARAWNHRADALEKAAPSEPGVDPALSLYASKEATDAMKAFSSPAPDDVGLVERANRTIADMLETFDGVPAAEAAQLIRDLLTARAPEGLVERQKAEIERLNSLISTPFISDFFEAVKLEAAHQQDRWGTEGDAGKAPEDWLFLVGFLCGKAAASFRAGDHSKGIHHIISSAAVCLNWHRNVIGEVTAMRPGIDGALLAALPGASTATEGEE